MRACLAVLAVLAIAAPIPARADDRAWIARTAYLEARSDGIRGMLAVAFVIRNRMIHAPKLTAQQVVLAPSQFAVWARGYRPVPDDPSYALALKAAHLALSGKVRDPTGGSTHFYERSIRPPWASKMKVLARIGRHIFLRPRGD